MIFDSHTISFFVSIACAFFGLWSAVRIYKEKKKKTTLVCPLRANCDKVVHSTYSKTFGVPNELLGILYYLVIAGSYTVLLSVPEAFSFVWLRYCMLLMTFFGVLLSVYFVVLQAVVIRSWCSLCLFSALASTSLGVLAVITLIDSSLVASIGDHRTWWIIVHSIGFVLGVGAATISDIFFFKFLKSHRISESEKSTLETLSTIIWIGLALLVISGTMLFLPEQARLSESPKFLLKTIVVGIIIVNGTALNLFVSPRMRRLSFEGTKPARQFRRLAFALGAISIVSWYIAFFLGSLRHIGKYSFQEAVVGYGVMLFFVVILSQLFERIMVKKYHLIPDQTKR